MKKLFIIVLLFIANMGFAQEIEVNIILNEGGDHTHYEIAYREITRDEFFDGDLMEAVTEYDIANATFIDGIEAVINNGSYQITSHVIDGLTQGSCYKIWVRSYLMDNGQREYSRYALAVKIKLHTVDEGVASALAEVYCYGVLRPRALRSIPLATPKVTFVPEKNTVIKDK